MQAYGVSDALLKWRRRHGLRRATAQEACHGVHRPSSRSPRAMLSLHELALKHGCSHSAIANFAGLTSQDRASFRSPVHPGDRGIRGGIGWVWGANSSW